MINENEKYNIKDFYIDKDKFCFKLIGESGNNTKDKNIIKNFPVKEFIQMEFFNCIILKQ